MSDDSHLIPSIVFIVPYRNRENDKNIFLEKMKFILEDETEPYEIFFSHQYDNRPFNRGAVKNIGFIALKNKYPDHYKDITFVFNDVDTFPCDKNIINYNTTSGIVKHFYGFKFALGGIFSIKGEDFEKSKGFPNLWGWGIEDNLMNDRCLEVNLKIDRSNFYDISDTKITRLFDGYNRTISKKDTMHYSNKSCDSMVNLNNIKYRFNGIFINILSFDCISNHTDQIYDIINIKTVKKLKITKAYEFRRNWSMFKK